MWFTVSGSVIGVVSFVGNLLVVMAIVRVKRLKTPSNTLVAFLCVADMFVSSTVITSFIVADFFPGVSKPVCSLVLCLHHSGWCLGCATVEAITFDRFVAIQRPLIYRKYATIRMALWVIGILSVMFLAFGAIHYAVFQTTPGCCYRELFTKTTGVHIMTVFRMIVFVEMVTLYGFMFRKAFRYTKNVEIAKTIASGVQRVKDKRRLTHIIEMKALKTCGIILGTYLLMWIPPIVYFNLIARVDENLRLAAYPALGVIAHHCPAVSSAVNPLVYALMRSDIRKGINRLLRNKALKNKRCLYVQTSSVV